MIAFRAIPLFLAFAVAVLASGAAFAAEFPPAGNGYATKDDIRWLWEQDKRRWEQSEQQWGRNERNEERWLQSELSGQAAFRKEMAEFKAAVIILSAGIYAALLALFFQHRRRFRS